MFKRKLPKQFNMHTRYYDPDKEERERRNKRIKRNKENYTFDKNDFKEELSYRWGLKRESKSTFNKRYTSFNRILIFVIIAAVLIGIIAYIRLT